MSPFLGSFMRYPSLQSDDTSSFPQIFVKRRYNSATRKSMSVLSASAGMSSGLSALLFFNCFMTLPISSLVGLSHLVGRSTSAGCVSGGPAGQVCSEVLYNVQPIC